MANDNNPDFIKGYIARELTPAEGRGNESNLYPAVVDFQNGLREKLKKYSGYADGAALDARVNAATSELKKQLLEPVVAGAKEGGEPILSEEDKKAQEAGKGMAGSAVSGILGWIGGLIGGLGSLLMSLLRYIPMFDKLVDSIGGKVSDTLLSNKTDDEKAKAKMVAGAVKGFKKKIKIDGQEFAVSGEALSGLYADMMKQDFTKAPVNSVAALSDEAKLKAASAGGTAGATDMAHHDETAPFLPGNAQKATSATPAKSVQAASVAP
jgi:hypothetical protein